MQKNSAQRAPVPTESVEQQLLFRWARFYVSKYPELALLYHIPNGGSRRKSEAGRFKAEGVKAGVPDLFLPAARENFHGLYIEIFLSTPSGWRATRAFQIKKCGLMPLVSRGMPCACA